MVPRTKTDFRDFSRESVFLRPEKIGSLPGVGGRSIFGPKKAMLIKTFCATCIGIEAVTVTVEVDISLGVGIHLVGLPDSAVKESLLRVVTALQANGFRIPGKRIVFNLAPADIRKEGSSFDLAIAVGLIAASEQRTFENLESFVLLGELALDGGIRPCRGVLPIAAHAREAGFKGCIVPAANAPEGRDLEGIPVYGVATLSDVLEILDGSGDRGRFDITKPRAARQVLADGGGRFSGGSPDKGGAATGVGVADSGAGAAEPIRHNDFCHIKGQEGARRGLEIAAAGGHNIVLIGPPGSGKTMMASCLPSILPPMSREESLETSKIYSVAGEHLAGPGLMKERPFRSPHHSASLVSLLGGGQRISPGEISLAHNGVLYLDEMVQFGRMSLDSLRQPLEEGRITISRARYKSVFPAAFMLVASMNPCPCGHHGDGTGRCNCTPSQIETYMAKVSGPIMDRIDMHIFVRSVPAGSLMEKGLAEPSRAIAARVTAARLRQTARFAGSGVFTNARMRNGDLRSHCAIDKSCEEFLGNAIVRLNLSARAYSRILKVARTIADLEGCDAIEIKHLAEAIQYRCLDRNSITEI